MDALPAAVILAGGKSTRFGSDKASALLRGEPLLLWVVRAVVSLSDEIVVVAADGQRIPNLAGSGVRVVRDREPGLGPIGGLATGFAAVEAPLCFALACDSPLLQVSMLAELAAELRDGDDVALCEVGGRIQPLGAIYRRETALSAFTRALVEGERRLMGVLSRLRVRVIGEVDARRADPELLSFRNINDPGALDAIARLLEPPAG